MDNEKKIQEILREAVEKLGKVDCNVSQQVSSIILVMKGAIVIGHLPDLSRIITKFAKDQIELLKKEREN